MSSIQNGVIPAVLTPCNADGTANTLLLSKHCKDLLNSGCSAVLLMGTTGEGNSYSVAERLEILDGVARQIGTENVMVSTGACNLTDTIALTRHAINTGVDNVLIMPPFFYELQNKESITNWYTEIIETLSEPSLKVYYYHFPRMSGVDADIHTIAELHQAFPENFTGMKDSSGDVSHMLKVIEAIPGFRLFAGSEEFVFETTIAGGSGCISATLNYDPRPAISVFNSALSGERIQYLDEQLLHIRKAFEQYPFISSLKGVLAIERSNPEWANMRAPILPLEKEDISRLLSELGIAGSAD